jgi:hypothetical protein
MDYLTTLKTFMMNIISALWAFFLPIHEFMYAIIALFTLNFMAGLMDDVIKQQPWSFRKAVQFFVHCVVFFVLAASIYICGHYMHNDEGAITVVSYLCYAAFFFYGTNIIRNLRNISLIDSPMYRLLDFIYYVLTFKIVEKIPYLSEYVARKRGEE